MSPKAKKAKHASLKASLTRISQNILLMQQQITDAEEKKKSILRWTKIKNITDAHGMIDLAFHTAVTARCELQEEEMRGREIKEHMESVESNMNSMKIKLLKLQQEKKNRASLAEFFLEKANPEERDWNHAIMISQRDPNTPGKAKCQNDNGDISRTHLMVSPENAQGNYNERFEEAKSLLIRSDINEFTPLKTISGLPSLLNDLHTDESSVRLHFIPSTNHETTPRHEFNNLKASESQPVLECITVEKLQQDNGVNHPEDLIIKDNKTVGDQKVTATRKSHKGIKVEKKASHSLKEHSKHLITRIQRALETESEEEAEIGDNDPDYDPKLDRRDTITRNVQNKRRRGNLSLSERTDKSGLPTTTTTEKQTRSAKPAEREAKRDKQHQHDPHQQTVIGHSSPDFSRPLLPSKIPHFTSSSKHSSLPPSITNPIPERNLTNAHDSVEDGEVWQRKGCNCKGMCSKDCDCASEGAYCDFHCKCKSSKCLNRNLAEVDPSALVTATAFDMSDAMTVLGQQFPDSCQLAIAKETMAVNGAELESAIKQRLNPSHDGQEASERLPLSVVDKNKVVGRRMACKRKVSRKKKLPTDVESQLEKKDGKKFSIETSATNESIFPVDRNVDGNVADGVSAQFSCSNQSAEGLSPTISPLVISNPPVARPPLPGCPREVKHGQREKLNGGVFQARHDNVLSQNTGDPNSDSTGFDLCCTPLGATDNSVSKFDSGTNDRMSRSQSSLVSTKGKENRD